MTDTAVTLADVLAAVEGLRAEAAFRPILVRREEAARLLRMSLTRFKGLVSAGQVKAVQTPAGPRYRVSDLERYAARLTPGRRTRKEVA